MKLTGVAEKVFLDRYALKNKVGQPIEKTPQQMWLRVAKAVAAVESKNKQKTWEKEFFWAMKDFKYVPGGRILAGAGSGFAVTFYNCFVIPSPKDSRHGILETLKQMVEIMARGGGVGINLSSLRPRGARVKKVNGFSSGPCNWAELFSVATKDIIQQGGCFSGDTLIATHLGLVPVKEIIKTKRNWYVLTHKGYQKVTAKFDNGVKKIYQIKTAGGFSVKTTAEHKFLTFNHQGRFYLKKLSDLKVGENIVLLLGDWREDLPYFTLNTNLPPSSKYSSGLKKVTLPSILDESLAFLIGLYDADGSKILDEYSKNGKGLRIAVAENRKKDLEKIIKMVEKVFGIKPKIKKGDGAVFNVQIYSRTINEFLKINQLLKESSISVNIPPAIFRSPKKVVEAYLAGVFTGDGTNRGGKGGFRIVTVSKKFAQGLQLLLLNLGVASKIKVQKRKETGWKTLYTVTVNGARFMKRFYQIIAPYTEKADDHQAAVRDGSFNWPFNLTERFVYLSGFQRTIARTNPTTSQKAVMFLERNINNIEEEDYSDVEYLTTCVPDKISSITLAGEENVYDLEVDNIHLLSGNGFYTSNSRRGALMLMLWDWHPDIEEFITVKQDLRRINGANLSLCVSDRFMEAVEKDEDWQLVFPDIDDPEYDQKWDGDLEVWKKMGKKVVVHKVVKARKIWGLIAEAAWKSAEPGVVFMERY
ncbi:MAG: LAGLIDADG family homing endonuclease, partial [Microgenomates group bacterium]